MVQYAWKKRWTIWPKYGFSMFNSLKLIGRAAWYPILSHPTVPGWLECACPRSCSKIPPSSWEKHMPICVWRRAFEADHPYRLSLHVHRAIVPVYHGFSDFSYQGSLMLWVVCFRNCTDKTWWCELHTKLSVIRPWLWRFAYYLEEDHRSWVHHVPGNSQFAGYVYHDWFLR